MVIFEEPNDLPQALVAPSPTVKKSRAARSEVIPEKSKALKHMPDWIREELDETRGCIIPTVAEFVAWQADPWRLDYDKADVFLWLVNIVIGHIFPEQHYRITSKSDQIYQKVRITYLFISNVLIILVRRFVRVSPTSAQRSQRQAWHMCEHI